MALKTMLITGGAGFLGSALARALRDRYEVTVWDDFHRGQAEPEGCEIVNGDLRYVMRTQGDIVIHCAAIAGVGTVVKDPDKVLSVNLGGTAQLLSALSQPPQHLLFFSTSEVYGPLAYNASEDSPTAQGPLGQPRWVYAVSKLAAEHCVAAYGSANAVPWTIIRPFNVYGPGQLGDGAVNNFCRAALNGNVLTVHGDGTQIRSWCYVDDLVRAVVGMIENPAAENQVFNVGNPYATCTTRDLAERVQKAVGLGVPTEYVALSYPEIDVRVPNIAKARTLLGWQPLIGLDEGLQKTVEALRCVSS